jgi:hypothetical protein
MKKIKQATLYGFDLFLEVPDDFVENDIINQNTLEKHVEREKQYAVDSYIETLNRYNLK